MFCFISFAFILLQAWFNKCSNDLAGSCMAIVARTYFILLHMNQSCNKINVLFYCSMYFILLHMKPHINSHIQFNRGFSTCNVITTQYFDLYASVYDKSELSCCSFLKSTLVFSFYEQLFQLGLWTLSEINMIDELEDGYFSLSCK